MVTSYAPGDTVTVTIGETVTHPGHYRAVLSTTGQAGLPADPPVDPGQHALRIDGDPEPARYPVLADGMLVHTAAFSGAQSFTFKLPSNMTCTGNCVLQVAEFMSDHGLNNPGGCFYHHCANITIPAGGGTGGREARMRASTASRRTPVAACAPGSVGPRCRACWRCWRSSPRAGAERARPGSRADRGLELAVDGVVGVVRDVHAAADRRRVTLSMTRSPRVAPKLSDDDATYSVAFRARLSG